MNDLLLLGAIKCCKPTKDQFLSRYFLAEKPNGKKRFILNLKHFNKFVYTPHFKLEDIRTVSRLLLEGWFMASIDLRDAYFLVNVNKRHRKYLRFSFNNQLFEFTCLPFGLSSAPYTFSKLMKPIVKFLRSLNILCVNYLDDYLIIGESFKKCSKNVSICLKLFQSLGLIINFEKSVLIPQTRCKFLGFIFNSVNLTISLTNDKRTNIKKWVDHFLKNKVHTILKFAKFIGLLVSSCPAVKYGWHYTKSLEREKYVALISHGGNYRAKF